MRNRVRIPVYEDGLRVPLASKMLKAVACMNAGKTNPQIAEELQIEVQQVSYLLNLARRNGFKFGRNHSERERNKARGYE
jgi:hypothetical protein